MLAMGYFSSKNYFHGETLNRNYDRKLSTLARNSYDYVIEADKAVLVFKN